MMTHEVFQSAARISFQLSDKWYPHIVDTMESFNINTARRQAFFIAQIATESGGFRFVSEKFNYSVDGLRIFGNRLTEEQRLSLGRKKGEAALSIQKQEEIANLVYGNRYGNNTLGNGWKYRGRGLKQITFKANYDACGKALNLPLIDNPDLLLEDTYAAFSAGWFWQINDCNEYADKRDVLGLTKRINGGINGLTERIARTKIAEAIICKL